MACYYCDSMYGRMEQYLKMYVNDIYLRSLNLSRDFLADNEVIGSKYIFISCGYGCSIIIVHNLVTQCLLLKNW